MSQEPLWRFDFNGRWHAFVGSPDAGTWFELIAYDDGHWVVIGQQCSANGYSEQNLANAKRRAQTVWEAMR